MQLKQILTEMGESLVHQYGFRPASLAGTQSLDRSTTPVVHFLIWLESTPEAKEVLAQMGYGVKPSQSTCKVAQ